MDIKVSVLISMSNKTVKTTVNVDAAEWCRHPEDAVKEAILANHNIDLDSVREDKIVTVEWGDIIGRLDMDCTAMLSEELMSMNESFMNFSVSEKPDTSKDVSTFLPALYRAFPILNEEGQCDVCDSPSLYSTLIPHLNDHHGWTRDEIADWLETKQANIGIDYEAVT